MQLLILILISEPVGRLSAGIDQGVGAQRPFDEVEHIERRCSAANRRRCARIDPGAKEPRAPASGPNVRAKPFGSFLASEKGTRRKGETASRNPQKNGYNPNPQTAWSAQRPPRQQKNLKAENAQPSPATLPPTAPAQHLKPHCHAWPTTTDPHSREYSSHCD